jgi:hypothetical protein
MKVMVAEDRIENLGEEGTARWGRCFKALFGIPFWLAVLLTLIHLNLVRVG